MASQSTVWSNSQFRLLGLSVSRLLAAVLFGVGGGMLLSATEETLEWNTWRGGERREERDKQSSNQASS